MKYIIIVVCIALALLMMSFQTVTSVKFGGESQHTGSIKAYNALSVFNPELVEIVRELCRLSFLQEPSRVAAGIFSGDTVALPETVSLQRVNPLRSWLVSNRELQSIEHVEPEMILVLGGSFTMGCSTAKGGACENDESPRHRVHLSDFYMSKYEVTQAQWKAVMESNPSYFSDCDSCPVERVSWNDAQAFILKLNQKTAKNYRLPTEAEWEYAARGGKKSKGYKYAGSDTIDSVAWFADNSGGKTHPVGQKQANELGIYDMSGNVWEWCSDWYGNYSAEVQTNPGGPNSGSNRALRGGGWNGLASRCRVADRSNDGPDNRNRNSGGFRLVLAEKQ
jgi:formylglycine-generating enzyme required for sulfatase activity